MLIEVVPEGNEAPEKTGISVCREVADATSADGLPKVDRTRRISPGGSEARLVTCASKDSLVPGEDAVVGSD